MTDIEFRNISLDLPDGSRVLDEISLQVPSGSRLVLCGPSRAGKTTLLRILVGLEDATDGDIMLDDVVASRLSPRDRNLSMVFADYLLHPHLDTYDNIAFAALLRNDQAPDDVDALVEEVADLLALTPLLDERPGVLDPAQRQRTAIGRSLVREADAYLFDEAFSAQEPRIRGHVRSVTAQWQADLQRTSIYATSHPEEAATLADRVAVMNLGWVHQVGSPRDIYDAPADLFVAGFMGAPAMNLMPAWVDGGRITFPFGTLGLTADQRELLRDHDFVVLGIRPEHCFDAAKVDSYRLPNAVEFDARIDDVEWGGKTETLYLGYEIDPSVEDQLTAIEDDFEYDLFQNFFVAELATDQPAAIGSSIRIAVAGESLRFFDPQTAEAISNTEPVRGDYGPMPGRQVDPSSVYEFPDGTAYLDDVVYVDQVVVEAPPSRAAVATSWLRDRGASLGRFRRGRKDRLDEPEFSDDEPAVPVPEGPVEEPLPDDDSWTFGEIDFGEPSSVQTGLGQTPPPPPPPPPPPRIPPDGR